MSLSKTYTAQRSRLLNGELSCQELVKGFLERIQQSRDKFIYLEVYEEEAMERARMLDEKRAANPDQCGTLFGLVVSLKDVLCHAGHEVSAGSRILEGYQSPFSATAVERLLDADAIIIGRVNCDEFAMGSANAFSAFGPTENPNFPGKVPGGSSGGSAASVAAETCHVSLGSDTGGSVRQPAAFCGITGFKPTYGRISRYGLVAYGSSLDQIGILSHAVEDAASVLTVISGADVQDATCSTRPVPTFLEAARQEGSFRIGVWYPDTEQAKGIDPAILDAQKAMVQKLADEGHQMEAISFSLLDYLIPCYYVLATAEAASNLSRYDGLRYGYRGSDESELRKMYRSTRTEAFGEEVKRRILLGSFVLSSGYYDAYYGKAQQIRAEIRQELLGLFEQFDLLLLPTTPTPPWNFGERSEDPTTAYLADIFTVQANLSGLPAISVPAGQTSEGLPIGMQWMAAPWAEEKLIQMGHQWERLVSSS